MQLYKMKSTDNQFINKFREVLRKFEREIFVQTNECCCNGVTLAQCHALLEIDNKNKISVTELSKTLGLDKSTVSRTVDGLVHVGLVDRTIPEENRRTSTLQLTRNGKDTCCSINANNDKYIGETLSVLSDSEKKQLLNLFEKITGQMSRIRSSCKIQETKLKKFVK
jgi:DNA-binding MarR family transcriptional regulator